MIRFLSILSLSLLLVPFSIQAQGNDSEAVESPSTPPDSYRVRTIVVKDSIFMLQGRGGNIGVFTGEDGVLMIDDQFAEANQNIISAVRSISNQPIQYLMNTHHHGDHTGGNAHIHKDGTTIFSHTNARKNLKWSLEKKIRDSISKRFEKKGVSSEGRGSASIAAAIDEQVNAQTKRLHLDDALPTITFDKDIAFHYNDELVKAFHVMKAHTDGDVMVYFTDSNVIHTGDAYIKDKYPFIDLDNGGTAKGYLNGLSRLLKMIDDETIVIPGHGNLATKADVQKTYSMMKYLIDRVSYYVVAGKTLAEIQGLEDVAKVYNEKGFDGGFISGEKFVEMLYNSSNRKYSKNSSKSQSDILKEKMKESEKEGKNGRN